MTKLKLILLVAFTAIISALITAFFTGRYVSAQWERMAQWDQVRDGEDYCDENHLVTTAGRYISAVRGSSIGTSTIFPDFRQHGGSITSNGLHCAHRVTGYFESEVHHPAGLPKPKKGFRFVMDLQYDDDMNDFVVDTLQIVPSPLQPE